MITRLDPNADGNYVAWAASSGNRWACVDDGAAANDSDWIHYLGDGKYTAQLTNLPDGAADPTTITATARLKRDGGAANDGKILWRSNSTDVESSSFSISGSFSDFTNTRTTDPSGGAAWTAARANALEIGVHGLGLFAAGPDFEEAYCSWLKVDVTHEMHSAGGFACLVGSLVGAALGLAEMARLARVASRLTRTLITPDEYEAAWRDIRDHRCPRTFEMRGALWI